MFTQSEEFYDAIYSFKDYAAEAAQVASFVRSIRPAARTVLDVACGTGEHARLLARDHGFEVDGLDLDAGLLRVAREKHPSGSLWFDYRIETPEGIRHASEVHELGLFTTDEMARAFEDAGLRAEFDVVGLTGRGLWMTRAAAGGRGPARP